MSLADVIGRIGGRWYLESTVKTVDVPIGPMLAKKTAHVSVTISGARMAVFRLNVARVLFRFACWLGGFGGVELRLK